MPPTFNGMTRVMHLGIPFWKNAQDELYMYETTTDNPPFKLGHISDFMNLDWKYEERLSEYRAAIVPRPRAQKK